MVGRSLRSRRRRRLRRIVRERRTWPWSTILLPFGERRSAGARTGSGRRTFVREELQQLLDQSRSVERVFLRDQVSLRQIGERLIHRLHAELLAGRDRRIDLVDLFLAD